jgi:DNA-binding transcriptional LysR family regulator
MKITDQNLSVRQLRAFIALAEKKNFTKAAYQCNLSQSAFSSLIRTLEEGLGVRLFDRDTRNVELTPEGELFQHGAARLLEHLREVLEDLGEHAGGQRGRVRIAALPSLAAGWLPHVIAAFQTSHPEVRIEVADVLSENCIENVRSGRADFALASAHFVDPDLQTDPFCQDGFYLVCHKSHPLSRRRRPLLAALSNEPFIHLTRDSSVRQYIEAVIHPMKLNSVMELAQLSTVAGMVRAGIGITVVPALTLFHFDGPELSRQALEMPGMTREIFVVRRRDRSLSIAARTLLDFMLRRRPAIEGFRKRSRASQGKPLEIE